MLNNIQFYKPNSSNKGVAVSLSYNPADSGIYVSFIKQFSWNNQNKTGSFKENKDNPKAKKNIKFNDTEISGIIRAIEKEDKWSTFHKFNNETGVSISFAPYVKDNIMCGFGLRVSDSKDKENVFSIGFTNDESIKLREWLKSALQEGFCKQKTTSENIEQSF
jgi:hypothetical protein